jgi:hypothetical protein
LAHGIGRNLVRNLGNLLSVSNSLLGTLSTLLLSGEILLLSDHRFGRRVHQSRSPWFGQSPTSLADAHQQA